MIDYHSSHQTRHSRKPVIRHHVATLAIALSGLLAVSEPSKADLCPVAEFEPVSGTAAAEPDAPVRAKADRVVSERDLLRLEGDSIIEYLGRRLSAEEAVYDPLNGEVRVEGDIELIGNGVRLKGSNARVDLDDNAFDISDTEYEFALHGRYASGSADALSRSGSGNVTLGGATYSACPPDDRSWFVGASEIRLDQESGIGTADNIHLVFKGVPIFAFPTFSFPIDERRKTGFLAPAIGTSNGSGLELFVPWYWNIRPNLDATITPRLMSQRGLQLQNEFRYLNRQGSWQLDYEYLRDTSRAGDVRHLTQLRHNGRFSPFVSTEIVARSVSDSDYFEDLGDGFRLGSVTHLEQRADLVYAHERVTGLVRIQDFETVDENIPTANRPYRRIPQVRLGTSAAPNPLGIRADVDTEFVYFDKSEAITGVRTDARVRLSRPIRGEGFFLRPSASHQLTWYSLNNTPGNIAGSVTRNSATFSIDGGLFFERSIRDGKAIQTLEPRLFYLKVPGTTQSMLPLFDTDDYDFNIAQLFRENRFSGVDRIGDADQLSYALSSRIIDRRGEESMRFAIGQIRHFEDRDVTLADGDLANGNEETEETRRQRRRDFSDVVAEFSTRLSRRWISEGSFRWSPYTEDVVRSAVSLGYRPGKGRLFNIAHRVIKQDDDLETTEQIDLSGVWRINEQWRVAGRWNYALDAKRSIESLFGLEYDSCCWALRLAARRFIADDGEEHDTSAYVQLVLKGLAPLGQNYDSVMDAAIEGYEVVQ